MSGFISGGYIDGESASLPSNNLPADNRFASLPHSDIQTVDDNIQLAF